MIAPSTTTPATIRTSLSSLSDPSPVAGRSLTSRLWLAGTRLKAKPTLGVPDFQVVFVTDDNPRGENGDAIVAEILAGFAHPDTFFVQRDRARAIAQAIADATSDDVVLIAGKGHETYQEIAGVQRPFDDMAHARAALGVDA